VCPSDAVEVAADQVRIVDEACTRCGLCLPACPHEAISAVGDFDRALDLAAGGRAVLILSVEAAAYFYPATPEQVINACYAAGFRTVHRGVLGDELVAREYIRLWSDEGWGTLIRSTCPVVVETIRTTYPELVPYLAPVDTPIAVEARYLKRVYGPDTPVVHAGVCVTEGGGDVDAIITFAELQQLVERRGVKRIAEQPFHFSRLPEERRRHWSTAGGLPLELLAQERHSSRRFRKIRGLGQLEALARAVAVDRIDLGFVDILPCEGCLDHPMLGPREELFRRRDIVRATEPHRAPAPVVEESLADGVRVGAVFSIERPRPEPEAEDVEDVLGKIGTAPNGRPWDCGACGYATCRRFARAAAVGRTTLKSCPPYLEKEAREAQQKAAVDALTGLASYGALRDRLATEVARSKRTGEGFAVLFCDLDNLKQLNDRFGHDAGNEVLRAAAEEVTGLIRTTDLAARWGGDEFVVVLVGTELDGGRRVADKVRARVEEVGRRLRYPEGLVTVSVGVASYNPADGEREDVWVAADGAMYRAKAGGGNQVVTGDR
jgi:diguanylate cyclase (GGDEF)-like protein